MWSPTIERRWAGRRHICYVDIYSPLISAIYSLASVCLMVGWLGGISILNVCWYLDMSQPTPKVGGCELSACQPVSRCVWFSVIDFTVSLIHCQILSDRKSLPCSMEKVGIEIMKKLGCLGFWSEVSIKQVNRGSEFQDEHPLRSNGSGSDSPCQNPDWFINEVRSTW